MVMLLRIKYLFIFFKFLSLSLYFSLINLVATSFMLHKKRYIKKKKIILKTSIVVLFSYMPFKLSRQQYKTKHKKRVLHKQ